MSEPKKSSAFGRWKWIALIALLVFIAWNVMMFLFGMAVTLLNAAFGLLGILLVIGLGAWAFAAIRRRFRSPGSSG